MAAAGLDTTSLDDEAFNVETALDRCILRLIASCCNGELLQFLNCTIRMQLNIPWIFLVKFDLTAMVACNAFIRR